jgi:hypothetical protein
MTDIMTRLEENHPSRRSRPDRIYSRKQIEQAFLETFDLVGGVPRLASWANETENYASFLKLLMVLAPKDSIKEAAGNVIEYRSNVPASPLNGSVSGIAEGEFIPAGDAE